MSLQVSYKKQVLVIFMLTLVFFAVLEIMLRAYDFFNPRCDFMINPVSIDYDYDFKKQVCEMWRYHLVYIDPMSGISQSIPNQHFPTLNINSNGFRGSEILMEKPDNSFRIFVVGGSTTFAMRSLDQETIPGYLQQNFDKLNLGKKIEVINAGIDAITSSDELQLIKTKLLHFEPDLIIIYDGNNDIVNFPGKIKNKWNDDIITQIWKKYFSFYETPYVVGGIIDDFKSSISIAIFKPVSEENAQVWKKNMIDFCELGTQQGFETMVVLQPFLGTGNKSLSEFEIKNSFGDYAKLTTNLVNGYEYFAEELSDLNNYCSITSDFRNAFDDVKDSVYFDRVHVGPESNKIIADKIYELALPLVS